jgi:hypothetical protein
MKFSYFNVPILFSLLSLVNSANGLSCNDSELSVRVELPSDWNHRRHEVSIFDVGNPEFRFVNLRDDLLASFRALGDQIGAIEGCLPKDSCCIMMLYRERLCLPKDGCYRSYRTFGSEARREFPRDSSMLHTLVNFLLILYFKRSKVSECA